jgi:O-antigen ligase
MAKKNSFAKKPRTSGSAAPKSTALTRTQLGAHCERLNLLDLWLLLPLLLALGVVPLIVFLKIIPVPLDYQHFWITDNVFDFFAYYKARSVIICASFILINALILNHLGQLTRRPLPLPFPLMLYAVMIVVSALLSEHRAIAFNGFFERYEGMWVLLSYLVLMLGSYFLVKNIKQVWLLLGAWAVALVIIAVIGLFQFIGMDIFQTQVGRLLVLPSQYERIANSLEFNFPQYWIYATLYNPNNVASMMAMALPITATGFFLSHSKNRRLGFGILTGVLSLVLVGTHARGGWIAILCAALLLSSLFMRHTISRYWKPLSALTGLAVVAFVLLIAWGIHQVNEDGGTQNHVAYSTSFAPEHFSERLIRHYGTLGSGRLYIWMKALQMTPATMLYGRGPDTFALYFPNQDGYKRFFNQPEAFIDKPHNLYLQNWLALGGVATVAFLALLILHAVRTWRLLNTATPSGDAYLFAAGLYAGWFAYLISGLFYDSVVAVAPIFWIIFGLSLAVNHQLDIK